MEPTQSRLKELFDYHKDGYLIWINKSTKMANTSLIDSFAGCLTKGEKLKDYWSINVDNKSCKAHRLIWIWHFGKITKKEIDHINGNGLDNKIENLRQVSRSQNMMNQKINVLNTSGAKGVHFSKNHKKWLAYIKIDQKRIHVGSFDNLFSAAIARKEAEQKYFGEFARKETK